ncbi:lmo0937 family membrane protein [Clostridium massiliodielmoense]|uniref:lmo0937 family membrane protein n=1 Tax=Clostridium massiliodielmoense TaxID=1776385 RepID=UPI000AF00351|nr:lmo0937 family membrane protein [Clostridium massiliodielmoense]
MKVLHWIGAVVVFFWVLGLVFRIGGKLINLLLVVSAIVFLYDIIIGKKNRN